MGIPFSPTGNIAPAANDNANFVIAGAFVGTGTSVAAPLYGTFNVILYGPSGPNGNWQGSVQIERSFDGGVTWVIAGIGGAGQQAVYASAGTGSDVSIVGNEPERGVGYRLHCTSFTSGPINYRLSATGVLGTTNGIPS